MRVASLHDALPQFRGQVGMVFDIAAVLRVVLDGHDVGATDTDAAHELVEVDEFLQDHGQRVRLVVGADQLVDRVDLVHVLPAAAPGVLEDSGQPDIGDDGVPVQRIVQVAQTLADDALDIRLVGQDQRSGRRDSQAGNQAGAEELVVRAPPERVVDGVRALEQRVLR